MSLLSGCVFLASLVHVCIDSNVTETVVDSSNRVPYFSSENETRNGTEKEIDCERGGRKTIKRNDGDKMEGRKKIFQVVSSVGSWLRCFYTQKREENRMS